VLRTLLILVQWNCLRDHRPVVLVVPSPWQSVRAKHLLVAGFCCRPMVLFLLLAELEDKEVVCKQPSLM
jgi:hypothetical protein